MFFVKLFFNRRDIFLIGKVGLILIIIFLEIKFDFKFILWRGIFINFNFIFWINILELVYDFLDSGSMFFRNKDWEVFVFFKILIGCKLVLFKDIKLLNINGINFFLRILDLDFILGFLNLL